MLQLATACDGVHTSKMNCSLRLIFFFFLFLSLSDRQKWKKSSHSSPPSWLDSFFHAASLQWLPQKQLLSTFAGGGGEVGFSWGDCVPVWCLWLLLASLFSTQRRQNNFFRVATSQTDYKAAACRRRTHSRASFMHNLSSSKVLTTLKDNVTVHFEGHKDLQLQQTDISWWWGISVRKAVRHKAHTVATSVRNAVIIVTRRPPSRLLSQMISFWPHSSKGQKPPAC